MEYYWDKLDVPIIGKTIYLGMYCYNCDIVLGKNKGKICSQCNGICKRGYKFIWKDISEYERIINNHNNTADIWIIDNIHGLYTLKQFVKEVLNKCPVDLFIEDKTL